jgi:hypothetical protein
VKHSRYEHLNTEQKIVEEFACENIRERPLSSREILGDLL